MDSCLDEETALHYVQAMKPAERETLDRHLATCDRCRELIAALADDSVIGSEPVPRSLRRPGVRLGRYMLGERLGAGGMGLVYRARDPDLDRDVAIKLVVEPSEAARARLLVEARAVARINHPNVVAVHDVGTVDGEVYVAMELVEQGTLADWLRTPAPWRATLARFLEAGRGLDAAHRAGLVHRDFKPTNVLIDANGRARVSDFGLAHPNATDAPAAGTPSYMAPEQHAGAVVDARADQYSFCVALRDAIAARAPRRVRAVIERGLAIDPAARWPSMDALLGALERALRSRRLLVVVTVALAAGAAGVIAAAIMARGRVVVEDPLPRVDHITRITDAPGCDESPVFAPDGRTIYFDAAIDGDSDLFAYELHGGAIRRLTSTAGWDLLARPSPDGKRLAWIHVGSTRDLWLLELDRIGAQPRQLGPAPAGRPIWLDATTVLVADRTRAIGVDVTTSERRTQFALDRTIAMAYPHGDSTIVMAADGVLGSLLVRSATGVLSELTSTPAWRDGGMAIGRTGGIYFVGRVAGDARALVYRARAASRDVTVAVPTPGFGISIAPDGKRAVMSTCWSHRGISRVRAGAEDPAWPPRTWDESNPVVVDAERLLISSNRSGAPGLWLVDAARGEGRLLVENAHQAAVSPDARRIVFTNARGLWLLELASGSITQIVLDRVVHDPAFDRSGVLYALDRDPAGGRVVRVELNTGELEVVTPHGVGHFAISPIDGRIAYVGPVSSQVLVGSPGGAFAAIDRVPVDVYNKIRFTAQGDALLVIRRFRSVLEVPLDGGAPRERWSAAASGPRTIEDAIEHEGVLLLSVADTDGDLFLMDGEFP